MTPIKALGATARALFLICVLAAWVIPPPRDHYGLAFAADSEGVPENSTGLSLAGALKWILVIASLPCFLKAWQGIVGRETATGYGSFDASSTRLLTGGEAVRFGLANLLYAALFLGVAWALWFFWQRNED